MIPKQHLIPISTGVFSYGWVAWQSVNEQGNRTGTKVDRAGTAGRGSVSKSILGGFREYASRVSTS